MSRHLLLFFIIDYSDYTAAKSLFIFCRTPKHNTEDGDIIYGKWDLESNLESNLESDLKAMEGVRHDVSLVYNRDNR